MHSKLTHTHAHTAPRREGEGMTHYAVRARTDSVTQFILFPKIVHSLKHFNKYNNKTHFYQIVTLFTYHNISI